MRYPSIDSLLNSPEAQSWQQDFPRQHVVDSLRQAVQEARAQGLPAASQQLLQRTQVILFKISQPSLVKVINATGILLHTNLGRAPLSQRALQMVQELCSGYVNLELDLASGQRSQRQLHISQLLKNLTGCEASLVVNNCAAAMLLIIDEFARGQEVLVSRGELVEIGGSFRIPEVLQRGGARLVEVGTTNRTYVQDYAQAITAATSMLLSTHLSNFAQIGFVQSPQPDQLVALSKERQLISVLDLGSGLLSKQPVPEVALLGEPDILSSLKQGWDLIAFSGDKLLGSIQAGIILGRNDLVQRLAQNPWMRALRVDKLRLAALQGSLLDHLLAPTQIPLYTMLTQSTASLKKRAQRLARHLPDARVVSCRSSIGGGTTPAQELDSWAICLTVDQPHIYAQKLRQGNPAILTRIHEQKIWLDLRTIMLDEEKALLAAL